MAGQGLSTRPPRSLRVPARARDLLDLERRIGPAAVRHRAGVQAGPDGIAGDRAPRVASERFQAE